MDAKEYVAELLEAYPSKKRQIEQLRFELNNLPQINDDEIISSLALGSSMNLESAVGSRSISDKTMTIALKYRDSGEGLLSEAYAQIFQGLKTLEKEISRLEHYLSLLEEQKASTIRQLYFECKSIAQISIDMDVTRGTVLYRKKIAIEELSAMYEFLDNVKEV